MKSRSAWLLTRAGIYHPFERETLAVVIPSRRTTNKSMDDLVRELHLKKYGRMWPNAVNWNNTDDGGLMLTTPLCAYLLSRIEVYG